MTRRHNFQTLGWFYDLRKQSRLDLDPPYQRRSVWNQAFKDYFVDTVLLQYPSPAIFLYEEISESGRSDYHVVDGKQRLTTMFEFVEGSFPISDKSDCLAYRGQYFSALPSEQKIHVWGYQFLIEYVPSTEDTVINQIFDRINRNVSKLSAQELRHAKYAGVFIQTAEQLADWMNDTLPGQFPRINPQARRQMKDVELVSLLLLLLEAGPQAYSQAELDVAYSARDEDWEKKTVVERRFRTVVEFMAEIVRQGDDGKIVETSRLRNQADFYSLFGAIARADADGELPDSKTAARRLREFVERVESEDVRSKDDGLMSYYEAARAASSDKGPRDTRINYVHRLICGTPA